MSEQETIAMIGGGVSGALTAYHLVRQGAPGRIVVVDPRPGLGLGLAYSTTSMLHLLNVPAGRISALPDKPDHFLRWLRRNHDERATAATFAPRTVFGRYIQSLLNSVHGVEHLQTSVVNLHMQPPGATLVLANGSTLHAAQVVLATGNFDPAPLRGVSPEATASGVYCHRAWDESTYANLVKSAASETTGADEDGIVLIGSGLTAIDVLLQLRERGCARNVTMVSRHGVLPCRHAPYTSLRTPAIAGPAPATARDLLHQVHQALRAGADWRAVVDSLRSRTNELWLSLPYPEQRRFRRHLQRRWEVVRHRMAPAIADRVDNELRAGTLRLLSASLVRVDAALRPVNGTAVRPPGATVEIATRRGQRNVLSARRVINCTGPAMDYRLVGSPLLDSLFAQGLGAPGAHGTGLQSNADGALSDSCGRFSRVLFNIGPGRMGVLLESIAIPELREQAVRLAKLLAAEAGAPVDNGARGSHPARAITAAAQG